MRDLKKKRKVRKRNRVELNFCVSFDGLEAMMLVEGTTTKNEFVKMMHALISKDENFKKGKSLIFLDNATYSSGKWAVHCRHSYVHGKSIL